MSVESDLESFFKEINNVISPAKHPGVIMDINNATEFLWEKGRKDLIKKVLQGMFNFVTKNDLEDYLKGNCRIEFYRFLNKSKWSDNPADFNLTKENLKMIDGDDCPIITSRLLWGKFETEADHNMWNFAWGIQNNLAKAKGAKKEICEVAKMNFYFRLKWLTENYLEAKEDAYWSMDRPKFFEEDMERCVKGLISIRNCS